MRDIRAVVPYTLYTLPGGSAELQHQSELVDLAHGAEHRHQLVLAQKIYEDIPMTQALLYQRVFNFRISKS